MKLNRLPLLPVALLALLACQSLAQAQTPAQGIPRWIEQINRQNADILMVGSSMQGEGIDFRVLSDSLGLRVADLRSGGSMSPWHYCMLKFVVPQIEKKPRMVIIETRQNYLMTPQMRMSRPAFSRVVNDIAGEDRALLDRLAFSSEGRPAWQEPWDDEPAPPDSYYWDFSRAIQTSLLPAMIELAKEGGYPFVVIRHKARIYAEDPQWEQPQHRKYGEDLAAYLASQGVVFLDYTYRPEIKAEHYANGDHLNRTEGRAIWTSLMAEDLKAVLEGRPAPNQRPKKD